MGRLVLEKYSSINWRESYRLIASESSWLLLSFVYFSIVDVV